MFTFLGRSGDRRGDLYRPHCTNKLITISFVTVGEILFGATKDNWGKAKLEHLKLRLRSTVIIPYDYAVCETYGRLVAALPKGRTIADNDTWIAACAVRHGIPLLTHNRKDFDDFKELIVISEEERWKQIESQGKLLTSDAIATEPPSSQSPSSSQK